MPAADPGASSGRADAGGGDGRADPGAGTGRADAGAARGRALLGAALGLLALGGAGLLWASGMVWAVLEVQRDQPLPPLAYSVSGSRAVPMVTAGGFILLAAVVAALATKTLGRRVVAAIVLLAAAVTAFTVVDWLTASRAEREASLLMDGVRHSLDQAPEAAALAAPIALGSLLLGVVAAVLLLVTRVPTLVGAKYERGSQGTTPARARRRAPAAAEDDPQARDRDLWKSLDRGEDPTG